MSPICETRQEILQKTKKVHVANFEDIKQLARASGSVGANYIEANENVGRGDLKYRVKVVERKQKNRCTS